jgi:hypothetical protein
MKIITYSIIAALCATSLLDARLAVIIDPVVDGFTISALKYGPCVQKVHQKLDFVPSKKYPTPRSCQLLFNTTVNTVQETPHEALIEAEHLCYELDADGTYKNQFWIPKKSLLFLDQVNEQTRHSFPEPLSFSRNHWTDPSVIVLTLPWLAPTNTYYSVGTRFVREPLLDTDTTYAISIRYPHHKHAQIESVPRTHALVEGSIPKKEQRKAMIDLIKKWISYAEQSEIGIPYVWGGSSFAPQSPRKPLIGWDCSSLILRAAQIVGIPLAAKTSMLMEKELKPLSKNDTLEIGDIIWRPGHVVLISDIRHNEIIQARGYESGYGYTFATTLDKHFKGVKSFNTLKKIYFNGAPVTELKKNGTPLNTFASIKILKLPV